MKLIARFLTRKPKLVILVATLLLIPSLFGALFTGVNYDVLSYLPDDQESVIGETILEEHFKSAATTFLMLDDVPDYKVEQIKEKIREVPTVHKVTSIRDLVGLGVPKDFLPEDLKEQFYSEKGQLVMIRYEEKAASEKTMEAIDRINEIIEGEVYLNGLPVFLKDVKALVLMEMPKYVGLAALFSLLVLFLCVESWVLPIVFMLTIGFGILYNFGTNIFKGEISYITQAIAAILQLAVTMDYAIFILHRYEEEKANFADRRDAMAKAIVQGFKSISGSSLTTIAGFGALCFMDFSIGMDLGIVMMKGVALGVLTCVTVLPALILVFDDAIHKYTHRAIIPTFDKLTDIILKHKKTAVLIFLLLFLPALYWQANTEIYYNINQSLPSTIQANIGLEKLKKDFAMETTHIAILKSDIPTKTMKQLIDDIEALPAIKSVTGVEKIIGAGVPNDFIPESIHDIFKKDGLQTLMITSQLPVATDDVNRQVEQINTLLKAVDKDAKITGEAALTKDLTKIVNRDIKVTTIVSVFAIFVIIALVFKSLIMPLLLVSCIELAIFINMGIPFLQGEAVPFVTPIIIGAIQLGATVDYSILMSTRYQEELLSGKPKGEAIRLATKTSAKSIITSMLVFIAANLGVVWISSIDIIKGLCSMLARGAFISGMIILFMLPPILLLMTRFIDKSAKIKLPLRKKTA
ncbi:MAG: antibiotic ABC transporter permease [Clostridiales bacterium]|nr:MAG: antibiotic ABC transporter permease [Clostridiales bacterium]